MNVYVAVAEEQGFSAAARRLQISPPAVTRAVAELEEQLGVKLLNRTTRFVRVTQAGQRYLEDARRILSDVESASETAAGINAEPGGHLTVTAPVLFGRMFVMPGIVDYLNQYPKTEVSAMFVDRVVNMLEEGVDVGIRIGNLPDSSLKALKAGSVRVVTCASSEYLEKNGQPKTPRQLVSHSVIASSAGDRAVDWRFEKGVSDKKPQNVRIRPRLSVTSNDAAIEAAVKGFGITRLFSYQISSYVESGALTVFMQEYEPPPRPVYVVHREGRLASARIRSFVDLMASHLRSSHPFFPED